MTEDKVVLPNQDGKRTCGREQLVDAIAAFLAQKSAGHERDTCVYRRVIDEAGPDAIDFLGQRLALAGTDWGYYAGDPLVRRMHHVFAGHVLQKDLAVFGVEHLDVVAHKPVVIITNHLSYADAHALDFLLHKVGGSGLTDRLTVVAGPKVYSNIDRRFSSLCFGTIKTPQNSSRSTEEAVMNSREVAWAARRSLQDAQERLRLGGALLIFAEGTRSRSGQMQQLLSGACACISSRRTHGYYPSALLVRRNCSRSERTR